MSDKAMLNLACIIAKAYHGLDASLEPYTPGADALVVKDPDGSDITLIISNNGIWGFDIRDETDSSLGASKMMANFMVFGEPMETLDGYNRLNRPDVIAEFSKAITYVFTKWKSGEWAFGLWNDVPECIAPVVVENTVRSVASIQTDIIFTDLNDRSRRVVWTLGAPTLALEILYSDEPGEWHEIEPGDVPVGRAEWASRTPTIEDYHEVYAFVMMKVLTEKGW